MHQRQGLLILEKCDCLPSCQLMHLHLRFPRGRCTAIWFASMVRPHQLMQYFPLSSIKDIQYTEYGWMLLFSLSQSDLTRARMAEHTPFLKDS